MGVPWWVWPQSVAWVLAHGYLWHRLVVAPTRPGWPRRVGTALTLVLAPLVPGALIAMHVLSPAGGRWITWPGFVWNGLLVYLLLVLIPVDLGRLLVRLARRARRRPRATVPEPERPEPAVDGTAEGDEARRRFLARGVALGAAGVSIATVGYGMAVAFSPPRLERVVIPVRGLPRQASGFRIALVADVHLGPMLGQGSLRRVVRMINETEPDLVAIPGDLVDGTVADLRSAVQPLAELRSRYGTYFSTGNHEYLFEVDAWVKLLRGLGVRTLRNERVALPHFDLAGVNDTTGAEVGDPPDYRRALGDRDTERPLVLLAHQPAQAQEVDEYDVDLQLSGHTHGGQYFPGTLLTGLAQPVISGLGRVGRTPVYVTSGSGFWGPPIRVGSSPEVTLIELVPDPKNDRRSG